MSESFRFIHAARLLLDHQLRGVPTDGSLSSQPGNQQSAAAARAGSSGISLEVRQRIEDATITAFNRVIDACLTHEVDFLLLVGDSFERNDQGLRGQSALARGLARLDEHGIPAFVTSGRRDPWSAWMPGLRFTENVHRLEPNAVPVTFERDGRTLARICAVDSASSHYSPVAPRLRRAASEGWSISLLYADEAAALHATEDRQAALQRWLAERADTGVDYWAVGGGAGRQDWKLERGIAHDPGSPQGIKTSDSGIHGCTLWDVEPQGQARSTFIPTSPVRFETRHITLQPQWRQDDLLQAMRQSLRQLQPQESDDVWLLTWRFDGAGSLFEGLTVPSFRSDLLTALRHETVSGVQLAHEFRVPVYVPQSLIEADQFTTEYVRAIAERTGRSPATLLAESSLRGGPWESKVSAMIHELNERDIALTARGAGLRWFATREGASA